MPHSYDKRKFAWPTGNEQVWYTSRVDRFPNGTTLSNLPDKVFHKQVRESLDKLCDSKKKKWCSLINCLSSLHIEFLKWKYCYSHHALFATTSTVFHFASHVKSCDLCTAASFRWIQGSNFWIPGIIGQPEATFFGHNASSGLSFRVLRLCLKQRYFLNYLKSF